MEIYILCTAWICSILAMTGFSILITYVTKRECREPVLLARLLESLNKMELIKRNSLLMGWIIHFAIGLFFMFFYELLWNITEIEFIFLGSILFGTVIGIIGISGWLVIFRLYPTLPKIDYKLYYIQLFIAHIIFSLTAFIIYYFFEFSVN